jgi:CheY-like chemotaxis protein
MANQDLPESGAASWQPADSSRLIGGIAHDLNNMLSAISGFAELLAEDLDQPELPERDVLRESIGGIQDAAQKATALTMRLLASTAEQVSPELQAREVAASGGQDPEEMAPEVSAQPPSVMSDEAPGSGTVLVVEDEPVVRDSTTRILDRAGFTVIPAANAEDALRLIEDEHAGIDVVVTDAVMPWMSGPDLAQRVQARHPSVGIVLLSGYIPETLNLDDVLERGAQFVAKPFAGADLVSAVRRVMGVTEQS